MTAMDYELRGRRALVTGGSRGIGRAVATVLAREGARVAVVARSEEGLRETVARIEAAGGEAHALPADLATWDEAEGLAARATEALAGAPEIVALAHGHMNPLGKLHGLNPGALDLALSVDVRSSMAVLKGALPEMMGARFGRVVIVGSVIGSIGQPKAPINSTIKAALEGLVRNVALDFGRYGVTANLVAPGFVSGERLTERNPDEADHDRMRRASARGELATPEDVAELAAFLCSTAAKHVNGASIPVDGGLHLANLL
jgi:NAD(P)-dependent dehydrogenase (short-subunit alcohol dehydrogenase family)